MSIRSNRLIVALRNVTRPLGINKRLAHWFLPQQYEEKFNSRMLELVRVGDCIWDVGANAGYYSIEFADRVGESGEVVAFEPSPDNLEELRDAVGHRGNITIMPIALGREAATVCFRESQDGSGRTNHVVADGHAEDTVNVEMLTGDLVLADLCKSPCIIKIDTEGFELDVLQGMQHCLKRPELRAVCVEIHFRILNERGMSEAPGEIERMLKTAGFRCVWPDFSHIIAQR